MTDTQRKEIQRLRQAGIGYVKIAQTLAMSTNTVKSFCQRNPLCVEAPAHNQKSAVCPQCRMPLPTIDGHRARRFCSDICRARYWAEHQNEIVRKSVVKTICANCGKPFTDYAQKARKYCCHACYIAGRYSGGENRG